MKVIACDTENNSALNGRQGQKEREREQRGTEKLYKEAKEKRMETNEKGKNRTKKHRNCGQRTIRNTARYTVGARREMRRGWAQAGVTK
jgi:hypothetical protein